MLLYCFLDVQLHEAQALSMARDRTKTDGPRFPGGCNMLMYQASIKSCKYAIQADFVYPAATKKYIHSLGT